MTKTTLIAHAKLAAIAVLSRLPNGLVRWMLRPFSRWLWPTSPEAKEALRREVMRTFAEGLTPD